MSSLLFSPAARCASRTYDGYAAYTAATAATTPTAIVVSAEEGNLPNRDQQFNFSFFGRG